MTSRHARALSLHANQMNTRILKATSLLCAGSLLFSGCANIKDDTQRTKTEGTLAGAGAGALIGGLIGAATGGGTRSVVTGALIGGAAGGYAGHEYGKHVAKKKQGYAREEERLRAIIGEARSERQSAEAYNASLRRNIASQRSELASIKAAKRSGQNVRGDASRLERNLDANISRSNSELKRKEAVLVEAKQTLNASAEGSDKSQLQAEYNSLQREKQILQSQIGQMNGVKQELATAAR